jgi:PhnB protein
MKLYAQLNFGGDCRQAFEFYERHLGGKIAVMMDQSQMPGAPAGRSSAVIHARLNIGDTVIVGNDVPREVFQPIRSAYLLYLVDSPGEAERVHSVLSEGGDVNMPMEENFFATRFSQVRDRFGVLWTIVNERAR